MIKFDTLNSPQNVMVVATRMYQCFLVLFFVTYKCAEIISVKGRKMHKLKQRQMLQNCASEV